MILEIMNAFSMVLAWVNFWGIWKVDDLDEGRILLFKMAIILSH